MGTIHPDCPLDDGYTKEQVLKLLKIQKENIGQHVDRIARDTGSANSLLKLIDDAPILDLDKYKP
jgi:hypothetical protein